MQKLIADRHLEWPFYFDGLAHENPHVKRFHIQAFPTAFLFDRAGLLRASKVKDEDLESEVRESLGLQE